jgi:hypothetical protein
MPKTNGKAQIIKALNEMMATPLQRTMALILYQVNGYENAMGFIELQNKPRQLKLF